MNTEPKINVPKQTVFLTCDVASINSQLVNNISVIKGEVFLLCVQRTGDFGTFHILAFTLSLLRH